MTTNQLKWAELKESKRHNVETETQGRRKLSQDYDVGLRQASAAQTSAGANMIQAATRQAELDQRIYEYNDTGKAKAQSESDRNTAEAGLKGAQTGKTTAETFKIQNEGQGQVVKNMILMNDLDASNYDKQKRDAYGYWTIDTTGDMIRALNPFISNVTK